MSLENHRRMGDGLSLSLIVGLQPPRLPPRGRQGEELLIDDLAVMSAPESLGFLYVIGHERLRNIEPDLSRERELIGLVGRRHIARRLVDPESAKGLVQALKGGRRLGENKLLARLIHPLRR